jgi:hypothetical protein
MHPIAASIRALRTVAWFTTGAATYGPASSCAQLPGWPHLMRAAQRLAQSHARPRCAALQPRPTPLRS